MPNEEQLDVLIVDDNQDAADSLAMLIRLDGHYVSVAYDSESGIALAQRITPRFIFHDLSLPVVDGFIVAERLRRDSRFENTTLIALTAFDSERYRQRAKSTGFNMYMVKPVDFESVRRILRQTDKS